MDEQTFVSIDSDLADVVMIDMDNDADHGFVMVDDAAEFSTADDIIDIASDMDDAADISIFS